MSEVKTIKEVSEIKEDIKKLNLGQISELIEGLKKDLNIQETTMAQPTAAAPTASEKTDQASGGNVSIKVKEIKKDKGLSIIKIFGAIQGVISELKGESVTTIQAKNLAEKGEKIIVEKVSREKAEDAVKKLNEVGVEVELKEVK